MLFNCSHQVILWDEINAILCGGYSRHGVTMATQYNLYTCNILILVAKSLTQFPCLCLN